MPPRYASRFWKTCIKTIGWRPSSSSASRVWLKYASVYQPARIFSTGSSKTAGSRRLRVRVAKLQLQARVESRAGDLELLGRRLLRRERVLQLVPGLRERDRDRIARV